VATGAPLSGVDGAEIPLGRRKTYIGQAKAQRAKGFEHVDITFDESTPPEDPDSGSR
jgi:membrane protein